METVDELEEAMETVDEFEEVMGTSEELEEGMGTVEELEEATSNWRRLWNFEGTKALQVTFGEESQWQSVTTETTTLKLRRVW